MDADRTVGELDDGSWGLMSQYERTGSSNCDNKSEDGLKINHVGNWACTDEYLLFKILKKDKNVIEMPHVLRKPRGNATCGA